MRYLMATALLALALAGCGNNDAEKARNAGTAVGEILPGSASDAMVPVDQVKSQPPLAPKTEVADKPEAKPSGKPKPGASAAAPAAEPAGKEPATEPVAAD